MIISLQLQAIDKIKNFEYNIRERRGAQLE